MKVRDPIASTMARQRTPRLAARISASATASGIVVQPDIIEDVDRFLGGIHILNHAVARAGWAVEQFAPVACRDAKAID
jgi:hypothetical protein